MEGQDPFTLRFRLEVFQTAKVMGIPAPNSVVVLWLGISLEIFCNGIVSSGKAKRSMCLHCLSLSLGRVAGGSVLAFFPS